MITYIGYGFVLFGVGFTGAYLMASFKRGLQSST